MSKTERRRTRVSSTIDRLPDDIKGRLDLKLTDTANTYEELSAWLKEEGYEISKSAIGRYAIRSTQAAQRVAETLQRTQVIAQAVEAHPDLDYTKAASMVLMDGLMPVSYTHLLEVCVRDIRFQNDRHHIAYKYTIGELADEVVLPVWNL